MNEYAAELARVTVWIGELQWRIQRGYGFKTHPVLEPLDHIECRDAVLNGDGTEAAWPKADAVVGNPPFLGGSKKRSELGDKTFELLADAYRGRVAPGADLVCYWFDRARAEIETGRLQRAGLVATNSIRQAGNRQILESICAVTSIYEAFDDMPWINDGAAVRVSLVCFGKSDSARLNGNPVARIGPDLTESGGAADLLSARPLQQSSGCSFQGSQKIGDFDIGRRSCSPLVAVAKPKWTEQRSSSTVAVQRHRCHAQDQG